MNEKLVFAENTHLETARLLLRPMVMADAEAMYVYAGDEEVTRYLSFPEHQSLENTKIVIANHFMANPLGKYVIEHKENHQMIGMMGLRTQINSGTGEIWYALNKAYWGQGLVPEAATCLLELGFEKLQLIRIFATHDLRNPKSGRVMEKIGMTHESTVYQAMKSKGEIVDLMTYGITKQAWQEQQK